jgi:hypothetical protein
MRDPARISPLLKELEAYWLENPDLRLGQIVVNASQQSSTSGVDPFFIEDDALLANIRQDLGPLPEPVLAVEETVDPAALGPRSRPSPLAASEPQSP